MTISPGSRLGPYEVLSLLGTGGMGEVWKARDTRLDRTVAIKVLPDHIAEDAEAVFRFEHEAKAVAALSHPNILAIHDFGTQGGSAYAVMEFLEGDTLRGKLEAGPIPRDLAVDYATQIVRGLSAAHEKGIVHRDLKPDNLFVLRDGQVKILDFGLAKRVGEAPPGDGTEALTVPDRTQPGTVLGTIGYMSPEQVRGLPVDHRSDIFSFGAIFYEMLSGKRAFKRATTSDTIAAILKEEPLPLSESGRNLSPALDNIVQHCLEKDRINRFQSAKDIGFSLSEISSPSARQQAALSALSPAVTRRISATRIAAFALAALLAAGAFVLIVQSHKSPGAVRALSGKRVAVLPFENLGPPQDDYLVDGIADEVRGKLTSLAGLQIIARSSSIPYKKTTKSLKQIARELDVSFLLTATVRWQKSGSVSRVEVSPELVDVTGAGAPTSRWQQPFDAALTDVFQVQSDIASRVAQSLGVILGAAEEKRLSEKPTLQLAAYEAYLKGEAAGNSLGVNDPPSLRKALAFYEQALALDRDFALAWARVSQADSYLYYLSTPVPALAESARHAADRAVALAPNRPEGYIAMGNYYYEVVRDLKRALREYERGRRVAPANADLFRLTAGVERSLGRWDAAVSDYRQGERLDPLSVRNLWALGGALSRLHRYPEARSAFDRGLGLAPANLSLIENKAMTFLEEGNLAGARRTINPASYGVAPAALVSYVANNYDLGWMLDSNQRAILLRLPPSAFDDNKGAWGLCLAEAAAFEGNAAQSRSYAAVAEKAFTEQLHSAPNDPEIHAERGLALALLGNTPEAISEGERAVAIRPIEKDEGSGPFLQHLLVRIYVLAGQPDKALDRLEPLMKIPYYLTPGWLKIDPSFDPLRKNPRLQKLER